MLIWADVSFSRRSVHAYARVFTAPARSTCKLGAGLTRLFQHQNSTLRDSNQMLSNSVPSTTAASSKAGVVVRPEDPASNSSSAWQHIHKRVPAGYRCSSITAHWDKLELQLVSALRVGDKAEVRLQRTSRLMLRHGESSFLFVNFDPLYSSPQESRKAPEYIKKVLSDCVKVNGKRYCFLGSSQGQLRERTAVLYSCNSSADAWEELQCWGKFLDIKNVAKLYKRVALLFSGITPIRLGSLDLPDISSEAGRNGSGNGLNNRVTVMDDIQRGGYTFTDGCGIISHRLAAKLCQAQRKTLVHGHHYKPSVFQIRYQGFKGIVHVDTPDGDYMATAAAEGGITVDLDTTDLLLRKSMLKVKGVTDNTFGLVEVSQPYKTGFLNQQFVMLLSALGVSDVAFLQLQQQYFEELSNLCWDGAVAMKYLLNNQEFDLAQELVAWDGTGNFPAAVSQALHARQSKEINACFKREAPAVSSSSNPEADLAPRLDSPASVRGSSTKQAPSVPPPSPQTAAVAPGATATSVDPVSCNWPATDAKAQISSSFRGQMSSRSNSYRSTNPASATTVGAPSSSHDAAAAPAVAAVETPCVTAKLRFRVDKSRMVFGIPDPTGKLEYGQIFFQPTVDGEATVLTRGCVLVARSPSYHPGDLRVLEAVHIDELKALKDVLVFPVRGPRPHADECSGGDYDGDQFFVCWEERLIPTKEKLLMWPPLDYSGATESVSARVDHAALVHYFAHYDKHLLGRLNSYYMRWAELKGAVCMECIQLAVLFSKGVDAVKTGDRTAVPPHLIPPKRTVLNQADATDSAASPSNADTDSSGNHCSGLSVQGDNSGSSTAPAGQPATTSSSVASSGASPSHATPRIWTQLLRQAQKFVGSWQQQRLASSKLSDITCGLSLQDMQELLVSRDITAREYDLLRLAVNWYQQHGRDEEVELADLVDVLDFGKMTAQQCAEAVLCGVRREVVYNDLTRSQLLSASQIAALGGVGQGSIRWRLYCEGALNSNTSWDDAISGIFRASTRFYKKLLVFQVHNPHQTIVLFLPHQYPGEGVYPCATDHSSGQKLAAITWAMGADGYLSKQVLTGHQIDLDYKEKRLQVYRPRPLKPGERPQAPRLGDAGSRANSYLWLRLVRAPQLVQPRASGSRGHQQQGRRGEASSPARGRGRSRGPHVLQQQSGQVTGAAIRQQVTSGAAEIVPEVLQLSVDVLRFEPGRKSFTHFTKTTKTCVSRLELYVVSCDQHLEQPSLELSGTWEAFRTARPEDQASTLPGNTRHSTGLVPEAKQPSEAELELVQALLRQLPGSCCIAVPAADEDSTVHSDPTPRNTKVSTGNSSAGPAAAAATANNMSVTAARGRGPAAQQRTAAQAAVAIYELLLRWANEDKLERAVAVCTQICHCTDPQASLVPEQVWRQLLTAAARLHRPDLATDILQCMLQQQRQQTHVAPCTTHQPATTTLQHTLTNSKTQHAGEGAAAGSDLTANVSGVSALCQPSISCQQLADVCCIISQAVRLSLELGLLHCCPSVSFVLWQTYWDRQQEYKQNTAAAAAAKSAMTDDVLLQLILAAIRSSNTQPEAAGCLLQQLLPQLSQPWPPSLLKQLLCSVVTECTNWHGPAAALVQCITSAASTAAATAVPHCSTLNTHSSPALQYQLHWSSALTLQVLTEFQDGSLGCSSAAYAPATNLGSYGNSSRCNSTATVWDYIGAEAETTGREALAKLVRPSFGPTRGAVGTGSSTSSSGTRLRNMMVVDVTQEGLLSSSSAAEVTASQSEHYLVTEATAASSNNNSSSTAGTVQLGCVASGDQSLSLHRPCKAKFTTTAGSMQQQQLLVGDLVRIAAQQTPVEVLNDPCSYIKGRVTEADNLGVTITLPWTPVDLRNKLWQIGKLGNIVTFERCMTGLECMASSIVSAGAALQVPPAAAAAAVNTGKLPGTDDSMLEQIIINSWYLQQQQQQQQATRQMQSMHSCSGASSSTASGSDQSGDVLTLLHAAGEEHVMAAVSGCCSPRDSRLESAALNQAQQAAAAAAVIQRLTLIWGPPGTGKTHTIAQLLLIMLTHQQRQMTSSTSPILICAETHTATDNIALKLLAAAQELDPAADLCITKQDILRVGDMARVSEELKSCTIDALGEEASNAAGYLNKKQIKKIFSKKLVVFATCAAAGSGLLLAAAKAGIKFERVVIDEASQGLEPCCLLPILLGPAKQLVLVGDHKQLGPSVNQTAAASAEGTAKLGVSLFERLLVCGVAIPHMLKVQYRMHPDIAELPSACFYNGRLESRYNSKACPMLPPALSPGLRFLHVSGPEVYKGTSRYNPKQAEAAVRLVIKLLQAGTNADTNTAANSSRSGNVGCKLLTASNIGIITPYKAMVHELVNRLPQAARTIEVNTVDAFQGREKDVIIFCSVRSNKCNTLGFVSNKQRLNVSMTRARHLLVLVGDREALLGDEHWAMWVQEAQTVDSSVLA